MQYLSGVVQCASSEQPPAFRTVEVGMEGLAGAREQDIDE